MKHGISFIVGLIFEKLFCIADRTTKPRADMCLPNRLLALAIFLQIVCTICAVVCIFNFVLVAAIISAICFMLGISALLCWKNQKIYLISDHEFTYTTMFGKTRTYRFSEIKRVRRNADSTTLFVGTDKVHIEDMALLSERLQECLRKATKIHHKRK